MNSQGSIKYHHYTVESLMSIVWWEILNKLSSLSQLNQAFSFPFLIVDQFEFSWAVSCVNVRSLPTTMTVPWDLHHQPSSWRSIELQCFTGITLSWSLGQHFELFSLFLSSQSFNCVFSLFQHNLKIHEYI